MCSVANVQLLYFQMKRNQVFMTGNAFATFSLPTVQQEDEVCKAHQFLTT